MFSTIRDAVGTVRDAIGLRSALWLALMAVLLAPCLLVVFLVSLPFWLLGAAGSWSLDRLQGVGKRRDDPVFGPLTYEGSSSWSGQQELAALGGKIGVHVTAPHATGPGPAQHALLQGVIERQHDLRRQVEESLYREYQAVVPKWRKDIESTPNYSFAETLLAGMPILHQPAEIWPLLSDGCLTLEDQPGSFVLTWNCSWDEEHGVSRSFVDWKVVEEDDA